MTQSTDKVIDEFANLDIDTNTDSNCNGKFDFNAWLKNNNLNDIKECLIEHNMHTLATLNVHSDHFRKLICDERILNNRMELIPNIISAINSLKSLKPKTVKIQINVPLKTHKKHHTLCSKLVLLTKFMQSGKTKEMTDIMHSYANNGTDCYHIIFCSNNLFLTNQTQQRVDETLKETLKNMSPNLALWFANKLKALELSSTNKKCKNYSQLIKQFKNYRAILCCTNTARFKDIEELLKHKWFTDTKAPKQVFIWIDEMHSKLNDTMNFLSKVAKLKCVEEIIGISATPDTIFQHKEIGTKSIKLKPMKACDPNKYYGFHDIEKKVIDFDKNSYIIPDKQTLSSSTENAIYLHTLLQKKIISYGPSDVFYAPGGRLKKSHKAIIDVLLFHNFYVFSFNSDGTFLYKTATEQIPICIKTKQHLGKLMGKTRIEYELTDKPIGITGYLSIGQGNTLCDYDTDFYITKSVIGYKHISTTKPFITQVFGRCFGNIKKRDKFNGCTVYMRSTFAQNIEQCVLSGGLSEFALKTGKTKICYDDLSESKRVIKKIYNIDDDTKSDDDDDDDDGENKQCPNCDKILIPKSKNQCETLFPQATIGTHKCERCKKKLETENDYPIWDCSECRMRKVIASCFWCGKCVSLLK